MTVETIIREITYDCNGSQTEFEVPFGFFTQPEIYVYLIEIATGNQTELINGTDYYITTTYNDYRQGGKVVVGTAYTSDFQIFIERLVPDTQEVKYSKYDAFNAEAHEEALDRLTMIAQQQRDFADNTIVELDKKADKVENAIDGNFAGLDANGNITDSGKKSDDFADKIHNHVVSDVLGFDVAVSNNVDVKANTLHRQDISTNPHKVDFKGLTDTPLDYTGQAGKVAVVKLTEDGIEFSQATVATVDWGNIVGSLSNQTDLVTELDGKFDKADHIDASIGATDAGKPIILNSNGIIDNSMIDAGGITIVGEWTPQAGNEYPDNTGVTYGSYWIISGLTGDYTFTVGDLAGRTVSNGDYIIWGSAGWSIIDSTLDPALFYMLDGSQGITGDFQAANHKLINVGDGDADTDAINYGQLRELLTTNDDPSRKGIYMDYNTDYNSVTKAGFYYIRNGNNEPPNQSSQYGGYLVVNKLDDGYIHQRFIDWEGEAIWERIKQNLGWRAWKRVAWASEIGNAVWGQISGTLSSQTDLQNALDAKEDDLGNPSVDGYILSSSTAGNRSWIPKPSGGGGDIDDADVYMIACMM